MTHLRLPISALTLLLVLCSGLAHAQQNSSTADASKTADAELREKAFKLLESLATQLSTLQSAENRARIGSNIAGSIWSRDEKRARALFQQVADDINVGVQDLEVEDPEDVHTLMVFMQLREDTLERISKYDAELALSFLNSTKFTSAKPLPQVVLQHERYIELRLAKRAVANNPEVALTLARQSLERGFSDELLKLFAHLSLKHKEQAPILYKDLLAKLRKANLLENWEARDFAQNLAGYFPSTVVDEAGIRELINVFIKSAETQGCTNRKLEEESQHDYSCGGLLSAIDSLQHRLSSQSVQRRLSTADDSSEPAHIRQGQIELDMLFENGAIDQILALASKYPELEFEIYFRALMRAEIEGELDQAKKIATQYTRDPERQKYLLARVERYKAVAAMNEEQLAEAQRKINDLPQVKQRFVYLLSLANRMAPSDRKTALKLVDQASGLVDMMKPGRDGIEAQLALAMMYVFVKSERGFAIMESLLPTLNELVATAAKLDSFDTHYLRDGEWNMSANGTVGVLLTTLAHNAAYFAWCDFDRAVTLAAQFERSEIRMMAQLKLAQGILSGPPKRLEIFPVQRTGVTYQLSN